MPIYNTKNRKRQTLKRDIIDILASTSRRMNIMGIISDLMKKQFRRKNIKTRNELARFMDDIIGKDGITSIRKTSGYVHGRLYHYSEVMKLCHDTIAFAKIIMEE